MNIIVIGGSGFIGQKLVPHLGRAGHSVTVVDQKLFPDDQVKTIMCDVLKIIPQKPADDLAGAFLKASVIINLAGESIARRFTKDRKKSIYDSRVIGTRKIVLLLDSLKNHRVKTYISASATGYYGDAGPVVMDESSKPGEATFLSEVVSHWEEETKRLKSRDIRVVRFRQGHVLGACGGYLNTIIPIYKKGFGGPVGNGKQYKPWVHIEDVVARYAEAVINPRVHGTHNLVAGEPITANVFSKTLATIFNKPCFIKIPVWMVALRYGGLAKEIASSQRVVSRRNHVFVQKLKFKYIKDALLDCVAKELKEKNKN